MTSEERKEIRYRRRKQKRLDKKIERSEAIGEIEELYNYGDLFYYGKKCCNGVRWKKSIQNFELHLFSGTAKRRNAVISGKYKPSKYVHFTLSERGKTRHIDAPRVEDRQVQKLLTQETLLPLYLPELIYNNGASLPNKGLQFSQDELKKDLRKHFRKYGREGYVILVDFRQYFPSAPHEPIYQRHKKLILNNDIRALADSVVANSPNGVGLPLGVEPSQVEMIAFPSSMDNYIKCQLSIKGAGHYMDDYYILVPPHLDPKEIMDKVRQKSSEVGLTVNESKSRISPISKLFRYCKAKYRLTETGKVLVNGNRDNAKRTRKKIKTFKKKVDSGEMSYDDLWTSINGSLAYFENYDDHGRVLRLRRLFYSIYGFSPEHIENFREMEKVRCNTLRTEDLKIEQFAEM